MSSTNEESPTTFSTKTREWLNSLNSKPTSSQVDRHEEKSQFPSLFSSGNDPYSNLDTEQKRMPDLLVDNSFTHSRKRVWIGGKKFLFNIGNTYSKCLKKPKSPSTYKMGFLCCSVVNLVKERVLGYK